MVALAREVLPLYLSCPLPRQRRGFPVIIGAILEALLMTICGSCSQILLHICPAARRVLKKLQDKKSAEANAWASAESC